MLKLPPFPITQPVQNNDFSIILTNRIKQRKKIARNLDVQQVLLIRITLQELLFLK